MPINKFTFPNTLVEWLNQLGIASLYVLFGVVIYRYFTINDIGSVIWPGSGLALAAVLIGGKRYLWGVLLGALVVNFLSSNSLVWVAGATLASILEVLLGVRLLTRSDKFSSSLNTLRDYLLLAVLGGAVASLIGALIGTCALVLSGFIAPADYFEKALHWWMGDALGVVMVTPLILVWWHWWRSKSEHRTDRQWLEELLLISITFIGGQIVFLGWFHETLSDTPKGFMMFLFIAMIAIRIGIRSTTFALNMVAIQALSSAYLRVGFFANEIANAGLQNYWFYMLILSGVGMTMAAYVNELSLKEFDLRESTQHLKRILDNLFSYVALLDINGVILEVNKAQLNRVGFHRKDVIGQHFYDMPWWSYDEKVRAQLMWVIEAAKQGETRRYDVAIKIGNSLVPIDFQISPVRDESGRIVGLLPTGVDITARKQAESALKESAAELQEAQRISHVGNWQLDLATNHVVWSDELYHMFGLSPKLPPPNYAEYYRFFTSESWERLSTSMLHIQKTGHPYELELEMVRANGECRWMLARGEALRNTSGAIATLRGVAMDITERKRAEEQIKHLSDYDTLTQLPNRRLLMDRLKHATTSSSRSKNNCALLFIDLDNFKTLNDILGHDIGDMLLKKVGERLSACIREGDTVARLGGDEFVIILENMSENVLEAANQVEMVGFKILTTLNHPYDLAGNHHVSTPSIGITLFSGHMESMEALLKRADIAMYQAKKAGRNTLRFYDPEMQAAVIARAALEDDLRHALAKNQFKLYFQLQANHNRQITGAEVLLRWQCPKRGLVPPLDFIPLAEETGQILSIGQWVLETACAQLKLWEGNSCTRDLQLAVNVSARQFHQADYVEQVCKVLRSSAIKPDRLKLELTESLVLDSIEDTIIKMHALSEIGVHFSMDDFGIGYSSLSYLTQLPFDQLKIDQSFVRNISVKPSDEVIVQTIIGMAKSLRMDVIAEGVETEAQLAFLERHGCTTYQGYLFSRPVPLETFEQLLNQTHSYPKYSVT